MPPEEPSFTGSEKPPKAGGLAEAGASVFLDPNAKVAAGAAAGESAVWVLGVGAADPNAPNIGAPAGGISGGLAAGAPRQAEVGTAGTAAAAAPLGPASAPVGGPVVRRRVGVPSTKERSGGAASPLALGGGATSLAASRWLAAAEACTAQEWVGRVCRSGVSSISRVRRMRWAATELALLLTRGGAPDARRRALVLGSCGLSMPTAPRSRLALGGGASGDAPGARRPNWPPAGEPEGATEPTPAEGRPATEVSHVAAGRGAVGAA